MLKKRNKLIALVGIAVLLAIAFWYFSGTKPENEIWVAVKSGDFEVSVNSAGELEPKTSTEIVAPTGLQSIGVYEVKISTLVPEGTIIKEGDEVASLSPTDVLTRLKDRENDLTKIEAQYLQTKLDTNLNLRQARDELINLRYAVKEKEIVLEQSKFEPPATIKQAEMEVEKSKRTLTQATENYLIKQKQSAAKMQEVAASLTTIQTKVQQIKDALNTLHIKAPKPGMVIYSREWGGRKKVVGTVIPLWNPSVATLPDLTVMLSKTFVNEVEIRKVQVGQDVKIGLDAFPEKKLTGKVIEVTNIGEQRPNSEAKVFEVKIQINESDTSLRPSMTTSNYIVASRFKKVLSVPLECLHNQSDTLVYVFKKDGQSMQRQEVITGESNDNDAIILHGLAENEEVLLNTPAKPESYPLVRLPLSVRKKAQNRAILTPAKAIPVTLPKTDTLPK